MLCLKDSSNSQAHYQNFWQLTVVTCFYPSSNLLIYPEKVQIAITAINKQFIGNVVVGPLSILCSYHAGIICTPLDFVHRWYQVFKEMHICGWSATSSPGRLLPRNNFHGTIQQLPLRRFPGRGKCQTLDSACKDSHVCQFQTTCYHQNCIFRSLFLHTHDALFCLPLFGCWLTVILVFIDEYNTRQ